MKLVCAWCRHDIGTVENSELPDSEISHGICRNCHDNILFQQGVPLQEYLDSLLLPVLVVNDDVVVQAANRKACVLLGKRPMEIVQHLGGNVFECAHSRLPEGCGKTVHCSGCAIRKTVTKTYETGEPQWMVPATLNRELPGHSTSIAMSITTMKVGNVVILQVEKFGS